MGGLVTFPLATVFVVVFVVTFSWIFIPSVAQVIDGIAGGHFVISALLRPGLVFTLVKRSLKLTNIACGHILMVLAVGSAGFSVFTIFGPVLFVCGLETLVCFVQCYVFYTLWSMYMEE